MRVSIAKYTENNSKANRRKKEKSIDDGEQHKPMKRSIRCVSFANTTVVSGDDRGKKAKKTTQRALGPCWNLAVEHAGDTGGDTIMFHCPNRSNRNWPTLDRLYRVIYLHLFTNLDTTSR